MLKAYEPLNGFPLTLLPRDYIGMKGESSDRQVNLPPASEFLPKTLFKLFI